MESAQSVQPAGALTGYRHPLYARSHQEFGTPRELPRCGGWIIERRIPGCADSDAMGCYPLFTCRDWSQLHHDVSALDGGLVSLVLVTDPFGSYDGDYLRRCFPDVAVAYKEHYVIDLEKPRTAVVSRTHRKEARRALRHLSVQVHPDPPAFLDTWLALHGHLVTRRHITGVAAFSRSAFAMQLATPGMVVLWASYQDEPVAATLYLLHDGVAHGHILGCTDTGYRQGALYALIWSAIETFSGSVRWINLMGVPGDRDAGSEGIRQFKRGWTTETRTAWLCGRILDRPRYLELVAATGTGQSGFFPAYRASALAGSGSSRPSESGGS